MVFQKQTTLLECFWCSWHFDMYSVYVVRCDTFQLKMCNKRVIKTLTESRKIVSQK